MRNLRTVQLGACILNVALSVINLGLFAYTGRPVSLLVGIANVSVAVVCFMVWKASKR